MHYSEIYCKPYSIKSKGSNRQETSAATKEINGARVINCGKLVFYREKQSHRHYNLIPRHRPHILQLLPSKLWCIGTALHSGRINHIQKQWHNNQGHQTGHKRSLRPLSPPKSLLDSVKSQICTQRVRSHSCQKHGRRNARRLETSEHQPRPQPILGAVSNIATAGNTE